MRTHPTDPVSLSFGAIFLGVAVLWLVGRFVPLTATAVAWTVAVGLLLLGGYGIVRAGRPTRGEQPRP